MPLPYTDLRRGVERLASIVKFNFQLDPYKKDILFLFYGRHSDRIMGHDDSDIGITQEVLSFTAIFLSSKLVFSIQNGV